MKTFNWCVCNTKREIFEKALDIYKDDSLYILDEGEVITDQNEVIKQENCFSLRLQGNQNKDLSEFWKIVNIIQNPANINNLTEGEEVYYYGIYGIKLRTVTFLTFKELVKDQSLINGLPKNFIPIETLRNSPTRVYKKNIDKDIKKEDNPFDLVDIKGEIRTDGDTGKIFYHCRAHELFLSFVDDFGCQEFQTFWKEKGSRDFAKYLREKGVEEMWITRYNNLDI